MLNDSDENVCLYNLYLLYEMIVCFSNSDFFFVCIHVYFDLHLQIKNPQNMPDLYQISTNFVGPYFVNAIILGISLSETETWSKLDNVYSHICLFSLQLDQLCTYDGDKKPIFLIGLAITLSQF